MAIEKLIKVTYHDFKLNEIIDPEKFDQNNKDLVEKIDEIIDTINSQETDLEEINIEMDEVIDTANEAKELAEQANTKANEAIDTSVEAKELAEQANTKANESINTANEAINTAVEAIDTAVEAKELAEQANTKADEAVDTANGIESIAIEAKTIAQITESNFNNMYDEIYDWKEEVDNNIEEMQNIIDETIDTAIEAKTIAQTTESKLQTARTITLSGDVSGSTSFDGLSNITINATVVDDSHNHVISNIDNLQSILDAKASVSHTHTSSEITDFNEATQDAIGAILTDTSTIDFTYDDINNKIKADVKPNSSNQKVAVSKNNTTPTGTRKQINFKDGTNISVSVADNATNDAVDVTITNTYTHPTGDGNLHVPATGTTNNNKVLKAGSTAGSLSWGNVDWSELTNKPSSSVSSIDNAVTNSHTHSNKALLDTYTQTEADLADAVSKKHAQNTDNTLTSSSSNTINTTGTGNIVDFKVNNTTKSSIDNKGNFTGKSASADKLATARTITLTGDVTGSASFDGSANISISTTVVDDSHNHVISNIDNLQTTLNSKAPLASPTFTGTPTAPTAPNGTNTNQIATTAFVQNALNAGNYGDMLKATYDINNNGKVDIAEVAETVIGNEIQLGSYKLVYNSTTNSLDIEVVA